MQINEANNLNSSSNTFSLFNLGFRIFFLAAGIFAILSMAMWFAILQFHVVLPFASLSGSQWHAHEMLYGYSLAVIAGFLLTAVKNWTGVETLTGKSLAFIFGLWALARLLFLLGEHYLVIAAGFDILFSVVLIIAVAYPVFKTRQWNQGIILVILSLLLVFNTIFFLGAFGIVKHGLSLGIYGGLYIIIGLVLFMARRVIPFFIERGVGYQVKLFNSKWIDSLIIVLWAGFFIAEILFSQKFIAALFALSLFIVSAIRLLGWHTRGIWSRSMLWSIYLACWFISLGFLLQAASYFSGVSEFLAIHAFSVGGVGLMTLGMMSRVALGHTGRDVSQPTKLISFSFWILALASVARVLLPLLDPSHYVIWIGIAQILWITAFIIFTMVYFPILCKPRVDNQPG